MIGSSVQEQNEGFRLIEAIGDKKKPLPLQQNTIRVNTTVRFQASFSFLPGIVFLRHKCDVSGMAG